MSDATALLNDMAGIASTSGWDVICSYDQNKINAIFDKKYRDDKIVKNLKFEFDYSSALIGKIHVQCSLELKAPSVEFLYKSSSNECHLKMVIKKGHIKFSSSDREAEEDIPPETLYLSCIVPICSASGNFHEVSYGDEPIVFKTDTVTEHCLFLHFRNEETTRFDLAPIEGKQSDAEKLMVYSVEVKSDFEKALLYYFRNHTSEISYELARINNRQNGSIIPITPLSFVFGFSAPYGSSPAALSLYIQAKESGNDPGQTNPVFKPGSLLVSPIADGFTASLIISGNFMQTLLKKGLSGYHPTIVSHKSYELTLSLDGPAESIVCPGYSNGANDWFEGITLNTANTRIFLSMTKNGSGNAISDLRGALQISYASEEASGYYSCWRRGAGQVSGGEGYLYAKCEINKKEPAAFSDNGLIPISANIKSSDVSVTTRFKMTSGNWRCDTDSVVSAIKNSIPSKLNGLQISMNSINTFLVTNLLFPEKNYFVFNSGANYYMPYDFIAFGYLDFSAYMDNMNRAAMGIEQPLSST